MSYPRLSRALFLLLAALVLLVFRDYGITWDEPDHNDYGRMAARFYASGLRELPDDPYLHLYGAAFDGPASVIGSVSPLGLWPTRHLMNALVGLLGIAGTWSCARSLAGEGAAFWAALLLALTPCWWGHMFNNPKDIPFATGYVWSLALLLRFLAAWPAVPVRLALLLGVVTGLSMGIRVGGVLLLGYLAIAAVWRARGPDDPGVRRAAGPALGAAALAWAVMLAAWPYALTRPFSWPLEALTKFMHYFPLKFSVVFRGRMFLATQLPWDYIPTYLAVQLPEVFPVLLVGGLMAAAAAAATASAAASSADGRGARLSREACGRWGLVALATAVPVAFVIAGRSVVYNGLRHMLFVVPPLACLAGAAMDALAGWLTARSGALRRGAWVVLGVWLAWHLSVLVRIHPYQYVYYNAFAGGVRGAFCQYEYDYWGMSYPEALGQLQGYLRAFPPPPGRKWRVAPCGAPRAFREELPPEFELADDPRDADFVAVLLGMGCPGVDTKAPSVALVTRFRVPLSYVLDQRRAGRRR